MITAPDTTHIIPDIPAKPWSKSTMPRRVLAIRLQAMGDLVITLPYLHHLKKMLPANSKLDLLTREEVESIPKNIFLFDKVYSIGGGRDLKKQLFYTGLLLPALMLRRYDVVIDLQNNIISRIVRQVTMPKAWSVFDRFSPIAAGESTRLTIEAIGLHECRAHEMGFKFKFEDEFADILKENGWDGSSDMVLLNPAGAFITRNWPIQNYIAFANLWLSRFPNTQFLAIGVHTIAEKALAMKKIFGNKLINLVNKTTPVQAFGLVQKVKFVLSEDSGLMHMAWVSGIPTLAMFGSTKSYRATPLGNHTILLHSGDLPCGNCLRETCIYDDTRCLTRYTPEFVFEKAIGLMERTAAK
jgi:ADP-heptose:LPS heptosyltransferase